MKSETASKLRLFTLKRFKLRLPRALSFGFAIQTRFMGGKKIGQLRRIQ